MEFGAVVSVYVGQLKVNNPFPIGYTQVYLILSGKVPKGIHQFMQIGYITILITGLSDAY
ncbi:unnamed protein product [marine sediment metagenome]|uniref:Uncharacterized protein n=1 Tax=marine sediment metagenome TaxID=412755 RepID=X1FCT5_9ZZZZ